MTKKSSRASLPLSRKALRKFHVPCILGRMLLCQVSVDIALHSASLRPIAAWINAADRQLGGLNGMLDVFVISDITTYNFCDCSLLPQIINEDLGFRPCPS
ncbi:hypothetical protein ABVK25_001587 [Lepraria finkii]|uniref:Uncharacterized protein n=1 Tax=Lepraria finkii TaxID=1340010 RepID=A0ABR4BJR8_9LECA